MQTGKDISVKQFFLYSAVSGLIFFLIAFILNLSVILKILFPVIGFFGIPRYVIGRMAKRRQKKFLEEFARAFHLNQNELDLLFQMELPKCHSYGLSKSLAATAI